MSVPAAAAAFLGGIGMFLLGMGLMTEGLKLAAGSALERVLASSTRTRLRGLGSGALLTALVQSSSAVTVATIGFVNAGLVSLGQALWVLYGANVGTTMTGWLVALVGLQFKVEVFALPLVGVGMLLRLTGKRADEALWAWRWPVSACCSWASRCCGPPLRRWRSRWICPREKGRLRCWRSWPSGWS